MDILKTLANSRKQDLPLIRKAVCILKRENEIIKSENHTRTQLSQVILQNGENKKNFNIISELKPASPSEGTLLHTKLPNSSREQGILKSKFGFEYYQILGETLENIPHYVNEMLLGGITGISVLTEPRKFNGSYGNLYSVSKIAPLNIPILLKDFIIDSTQIELGKYLGASNGLIIASICDPMEMAFQMNELGLEPLVEIHNVSDFEKIKCLRKSQLNFIIGINNRNLKTLKIDFKATKKLYPIVKEFFGENQLVITESGILTHKDTIQLQSYGIQTGLVGSSIMKANISKKIQSLSGKREPFIKICGIKETETIKALNFSKNKIHTVGLIVGIPHSHRNLSLEKAASIRKELSNDYLITLVSIEENKSKLMQMIEKINPDFIQYHGQNTKEILNTFPKFLLHKMIIPIKTSIEKDLKINNIISTLPKEIFAILLDSSEGNGLEININEAKKVIQEFPNRRIIVAGGLGSQNVNQIIKELAPYGLDASSSLETQKVKDPAKIEQYISTIFSNFK